jgi:Trypsin
MTWSRCAACFVIATIAAAASGGDARAVVGGHSIPIRSAPWTVAIRVSSSLIVNCTGSIIGPSTVVTAAHCMYDANGALLRSAELTVTAGVSNYLDPRSHDAEQDRHVRSFRVHPGFRPDGVQGEPADDIAVLRLSSPLDLAGPDARAVALPSARSGFPSGAKTMFIGFGQQREGVATPSGGLDAIGASVDPQGSCGQPRSEDLILLNAIILCASSVKGAPCYGDSGSGLVATGVHPVLIGVLSGAALVDCKPGDHQYYTYAAAPEIGRFIKGDTRPPIAPRLSYQTMEARFDDPLHVGDGVLCRATGLGRATSVRYSFLTATGRVLQDGARSTYVVQATAEGSDLHCLAAVTNPGGTTLAKVDLAPVVPHRVTGS